MKLTGFFLFLDFVRFFLIMSLSFFYAQTPISWYHLYYLRMSTSLSRGYLWWSADQKSKNWTSYRISKYRSYGRRRNDTTFSRDKRKDLLWVQSFHSRSSCRWEDWYFLWFSDWKYLYPWSPRRLWNSGDTSPDTPKIWLVHSIYEKTYEHISYNYRASL